MVDALIGSVIAVIATTSLALMLEAMNSSSSRSIFLNLYDQKVVDRVVAKRSLPSDPDRYDNVAKWMADEANNERSGK